MYSSPQARYVRQVETLQPLSYVGQVDLKMSSTFLHLRTAGYPSVAAPHCQLSEEPARERRLTAARDERSPSPFASCRWVSRMLRCAGSWLVAIGCLACWVPPGAFSNASVCVSGWRSTTTSFDLTVDIRIGRCTGRAIFHV